ncbi:hypothetical protein SAMN04488057_102185 [Cyclobacterium lianum]|uniref:Uncharacterized protein n=1 Tax=Cyclobacterium lianum TaxID=388280 RepID=A0A1M7JVZ0_9BACT|nr:hypothetical protein SAMN04488057_102185 [Cyclobacterium lianum]
MYFFIINGIIKNGGQKIMLFVKFLTKDNTDNSFLMIKYNNYNTNMVILRIYELSGLGIFVNPFANKL